MTLYGMNFVWDYAMADVGRHRDLRTVCESCGGAQLLPPPYKVEISEGELADFVLEGPIFVCRRSVALELVHRFPRFSTRDIEIVFGKKMRKEGAAIARR